MEAGKIENLWRETRAADPQYSAAYLWASAMRCSPWASDRHESPTGTRRLSGKAHRSDFDKMKPQELSHLQSDAQQGSKILCLGTGSQKHRRNRTSLVRAQTCRNTVLIASYLQAGLTLRPWARHTGESLVGSLSQSVLVVVILCLPQTRLFGSNFWRTSLLL